MSKNKIFVLLALLLLLFIPLRALRADSPLETPVTIEPVKVGIYQNKPLIFTDEAGRVSGVYADLLDYIAKKEGWRIEYVACNWADCLNLLERGEIDLMTAIAYSEARDEQYDFNRETALSNWGQVYAPRHSDIQSILDLEGKRIAVLEDDIHAQKLAEILNEFRIESELVKLQSYSAVFELIEEQKVDAGVVNRLFAAQNEYDYGVAKTSIIFNPLEIRFAAPEGRNQDLLLALDRNLAELRKDPDSIYHQSLNKWLGFAESTRFELPDWLKWTLTVAVLLILFFAVTTVVSRVQVKTKTAELREQNKKLRREIAEREHAEIALQKSEQKYRGLFNGVPVGLYRSTPEGVVLDANLAMVKMMGYPDRETILTADTSQIYVEPQVRLEWQKLLAEKGVVYNFEAQWYRRDGSIIWVRDSAQLVRDQQRNILYYDGKIEDITAQKRAEEEALRRNQELSLRTAAIEQSAEGVLIIDKNGKAIYVNPAFERINGYSYSEIMKDMSLSQILTNNEYDPVYQDLLKTVESGRIWRGRLTNSRKDGSLFTYDATVTPVRNEAGEITHYAGVQRDVTKLLELEEQYRQAQKMEAIGRLTSGIAHDFNNLLTAINGYADLLKRDLPSDSPAQTMLDNILGAGRRAASLIRQLLVFSRKQVLNPSVLSLNMIVADMNKMLQRIIGEHIAMTTDLAPGLRPVKADATQVEQVLMNLAINARDAMPDGGELFIKTANVVIDAQTAKQMIDLAPGNYVTLTVSDTGAGMSSEVKTHLFEPFFTTKEVGKGTGLGLATVFGIIKQSGGQIVVDSVLGQGSAFCIYLPAEDFVKPQSSPKEMAETVPIGVETLLVVEDDSVIREMTVGILRQYGYTVLEAADGLQALQSLEAHCAKVDLLLTDVVMPRMDGKTLADRARQSCPKIKILFTSGYPGDTIARHGVLDSGLAFMQKPFSPTTLLKKIRAVLDESS
ncbi:MAG: hypothetical protein B6243_08465 [Anaerolineaceae bacterium 4572_5.2]|nr:MAG: hypothetical protein B6243_08465 [Anaerolineaceae bacterium 4572_5.2]